MEVNDEPNIRLSLEGKVRPRVAAREEVAQISSVAFRRWEEYWNGGNDVCGNGRFGEDIFNIVFGSGVRLFIKIYGVKVDVGR
jgi:hypothetical protein